ncbi:mannose-6-phosphate isomerase-like protein (cupin superfamily) [Mycobacterium sp. OAS707]|uniref:cupin domain-containing protein n=1 Tax=unclassified Mycobacterium TaxID=2642494 RepID=UPI00178BEDDF|nr:cupin domain-containing protein [Mycobacterium sp. OAS707]MBE1550395.1 mannose-6-phosphate isomerase-like protein (cupin superfamily) [Mycobacterium sp. OAS707]
MNVRRVVTGHNPSGKSVFVSDELVQPSPTTGFHRLWGGDTTPEFPDDGSIPDHHSYFPPVGGFRFGMFSLPPASTAGSDIEGAASVADLEAEAPGLLRYMDRSDPGMHTTDTIDFEVVLEGTVVLELDDGAEVTLTAGDTVVQNGTRHRWRNAGDTVARLAVFMCGANHAAVPAVTPPPPGA